MIAQAEAGRKSRTRTICDKKARTAAGPCFSREKTGVQFDDVHGLRTLFALSDVKFDGSTFFDRFEALHLQAAIVNENVLAGFVTDESVSLMVVKPLYSTF